jgi:predicted helicase
MGHAGNRVRIGWLVEALSLVLARSVSLQRVIDAVPTGAFQDGKKLDPWLYFYEDFLAAYDPELRRDAGAYYTPKEVVRAQVRLIDRLLTDKLHRPMGFAESSVITLDPAVGTGTYLLGVIDHALRRVSTEMGPGAVAGYASQLGCSIFGFEIMVSPYAVAQLRVSRSLMDHGATLPADGPGVYLTDTLESPHAKPPQTPLFYSRSPISTSGRFESRTGTR